MMETVLNVGLNDASVLGLATVSGDERFAWDSYRRLVADVRQDRARHRRRAVRRGAGRREVGQGRDERRRARRGRPRGARGDVQGRRRASTPGGTSRRTRASSSTSPMRAVFDSWNTDRARLYRRRERIPHDLGTAVNVCTMVFGNLGADLGHRGLLHARPGHRAGRASTATTCPTRRARTSSPGIRNTLSLDDFAELRPDVVRRAALGDAPAGDALPGPVRHRVHGRARQAVDAADPGRASARPRRRSGSPPSSSTSS